MNRTMAWLVGGLLAGTGVLSAVTGGFGMADGATATLYGTLGYNGIDNLQVFNQGIAAVVMFLSGVALMAWASAGAWKETGGY